MAFTDLLPDRPLTRAEFEVLERNDGIDAVDTDDEGPVAAFSVGGGDSGGTTTSHPKGGGTHSKGHHHH